MTYLVLIQNMIKEVKNMVLKVKLKDVSFKEFKKDAGFYYPYNSKVLVNSKGKIIAKYNAKTKRVSKVR